MVRKRVPTKWTGVYECVDNGVPAGYGALVYLGREIGTGKRKYERHEGMATAKDARSWRAKKMVEVEEGRRPPGDKRTTFYEWWGTYLALKKPRWSIKSYNLAVTRREWLGSLGGMRLRDIGAVHVELWVNEIAARFAPETASQLFSQARIVMDMAESNDLVVRNVLRRVKGPPGGSPSGRRWTEPEVRAFLEVVRDDPYWGPLFRFMVHTWVRVGELGGLRWSDVDLTAGTVAVQRTVAKVQREVVVSPAKSGSDRVIWLCPSVVDDLRAVQDRQKISKTFAVDGWVFGRGGRPAIQAAVARKMRAICDGLGDSCPMVAPHGIRRTGATLARRWGVDRELIRQRLGHKGGDVTDRYLDISDEECIAAALRIAEILEGQATIVQPLADVQA